MHILVTSEYFNEIPQLVKAIEETIKQLNVGAQPYFRNVYELTHSLNKTKIAH